MEADAVMDRKLLLELMERYGLSGFTPPRPASASLRSIAKIIAARPDDQTCIEDLTAYLLLNGIPVGDRRP